MIQKISKIAMLVLLAACLVVPVLTMNEDEQVFSDADNRCLMVRPERADFETDEEYRNQLEEYLQDRISDRAQLLSLYGAFNNVAFRYLAHPLYEYGLDGQAYFWFEADEDQQVDMDYLTAYADYIQKMYLYCQDRGTAFVYVNSPEKKRVYTEYIPDYVPYPLNNFEYLAPLLDERGVPYLDLTGPLTEAHQEGVDVYNAVYDVGHWNAEGALVGARAIISYLQEQGFDVEQPDIENDYDVISEHHDYLPASVLYCPTDTYKYIHKDNGEGAVDVTQDYDPLDLDEHYNTYSLWENDSCANGLNLLMFQGSYFNTQGTILYNQFTRTECIHAYMNIFNMDEYYQMFNPDIVIFESADYVLNDAYYSYGGLTDTVLN